MEIKMKPVDLEELVGKQVTIKNYHSCEATLSIIFQDDTFCLFVCHTTPGGYAVLEPCTKERAMEYIRLNSWEALALGLITQEDHKVFQEELRKLHDKEHEKWERAEYERLRSKFDK